MGQSPERGKQGRLTHGRLGVLGGAGEVLFGGDGVQVKFWRCGAVRRDWRREQGLDSEGPCSHAGNLELSEDGGSFSARW